MTKLDMVLAAAVWLYLTNSPKWLRTMTRRIRSRNPRIGAGASAAARARQLRTPVVRLATLLGIRTKAGALADRSEAGAEGERRTAALLAPLAAKGWTLLHDRALPGSRANVDHLAISPAGVVLVLDTKRCSARWPVTGRGRRLFHGTRDITDRLNGLRYESDAVSRIVGVPVVPVVVMHGRMPDGRLLVDGIPVIHADQAAHALPGIARPHHGHPRPADLAAQAARLLPDYQQGR
ncbi:nuclease-related domain-containing protein [Streptomyces sp. NPDC020298]|uniref:nuclease-related domain-containing protein n=1 Tax=unclassified Streptomyces TaxID=2593676 RepID=UPI0033CA15C3